MSGVPVAPGLVEVANPEIVGLALRRNQAGLRSHIDPGRFPGSTLLVPLSPSGRPVVTESFRTVPVFSDLEALQAWALPPVGFPADPELEPVVAGIGTVTLPEGMDELLAEGAWVVVLNPAGPGSCHLAGVVGERPLTKEDLEDPPAQRSFLGRSRGGDDAAAQLAHRRQMRDSLARPLSDGVAARDAGNVPQALHLLKEADTVARRVGATVSSVSASLHAARLLVEQGESSQGTGLADLAGMGSNRHAKPRLQLEALLINAEGLERGVKEGRTVAAGAAAWTADWVRRLAAVAVEQGSMSTVRQGQLDGQAGVIATTYNDELDSYNPDSWTPQGWAKALGWE